MAPKHNSETLVSIYDLSILKMYFLMEVQYLYMDVGRCSYQLYGKLHKSMRSLLMPQLGIFYLLKPYIVFSLIEYWSKLHVLNILCHSCTINSTIQRRTPPVYPPCTATTGGGAIVFSTFCLFAVQYTGNKLNQK